MIYNVLKLPAKLALMIWCRHLQINKKEILNEEGPLLIAANHPNSFLDAILLCTLFKRPVYSLARGDAFVNKFVDKILRSLKMFPVYRLSEGAENTGENYKTFDDCIEVFKKNGIVLIFSEGKCVNEWNLRALKKGTARLAIKAWEQGISLKIIPTGINYNSFSRFGKNVILNFGEIMGPENYSGYLHENSGKKIQSFNAALKMQLEKVVFQINSSDKKTLSVFFEAPVSKTKKLLLSIPAIFGWLLHAPLYIVMQKLAYKKCGNSGHYNSVLVGLLFLLYPLYITVIGLVLYFWIGSLWWTMAFLLPFMAISFIKLSRQL